LKFSRKAKRIPRETRFESSGTCLGNKEQQVLFRSVTREIEKLKIDQIRKQERKKKDSEFRLRELSSEWEAHPCGSEDPPPPRGAPGNLERGPREDPQRSRKILYGNTIFFSILRFSS
jgi:hypothetical protein